MSVCVILVVVFRNCHSVVHVCWVDTKMFSLNIVFIVISQFLLLYTAFIF